MGNGCMKREENAYFRSRKEAAKRNAALSGREGAAEALGVSPSTLADYELGHTKVVPVDKVDQMADLYNCPELRTLYCRTECPIGKRLPIATQVGCLESVAIRFLRAFSPDKLNDIRESLIEIAADGEIDESEKPEFQAILTMTDDLSRILSEMRLIGEKLLKD